MEKLDELRSKAAASGTGVIKVTIEELNEVGKATNDRTAILKKINGALKNVIDIHGPITINNVSSASKRIFGLLYKQSRADL